MNWMQKGFCPKSDSMFENTKLVLCDLDGSLLDSEKHIDSNIKELIPKLKEKGIKFSIVSGRNNFAVREIARELEVEHPYICNNGAIIYDHDTPIHINPINSDDLKEILNLLYRRNMDFVFDTKDIVYARGHNPALDAYYSQLSKHFDFVFDFDPDQLYALEPLKITLIDDNTEVIEEIRAEINARFTQTKCNRSEGHVYVINDVGNNKGQAVEQLAQCLDIDLKDVMVFGDNYNDVTMLKKAGYGILMKNANDDLKTVARYITRYDNDHHGISDFIRENLL